MAIEGFAGATTTEISPLALAAPLVVPAGRLANLTLARETVTGEVWANADEPATSRGSKRTVPAKKRFVPYFAGLELELWK
jgi:hypothetical protein